MDGPIAIPTHPFTEADHWPHWASQSAAATQATKQQPPHIDGESFSQSYIHSGHCGLDIRRKFIYVKWFDILDIPTLNSSGATLECKDGGNSVSNLLERPNLE